MKKELGRLHPAVSLVLYLSLIVLSSACISPILTPFSFLTAVISCCTIGRKNRALPVLKIMLPTAVIIVTLNALFNGNGVTVLFTVFGRLVTLEAVAYGVLCVLAFSAAMLWACLLGEAVGADEAIYLFGGVSPFVALLVSMVLGLVPTMLDRLSLLRELKKSGAKPKKAAHGEITTLVFWSLEEALETADSMRSRGFGTGKVSRFSGYKIEPKDVGILAVLPALFGVLFAAKLCGYSYSIYPVFYLPEFDLKTGSFTAAYFLTLLVPLSAEVWEKLKWKYLMSKI